MNSRIAGKTSWYGTMWDLTCRVAIGIRKDNCPGYAAEVAFFFLFALFPCLLSLTTLLAYLPVPDLFQILLRIMDSFLPVTALTLVKENLHSLLTVQKGGLLSFGVLLALWSGSNAVLAFQAALNDAYDMAEDRPYWQLRLLSVLLVICFAAFIVASLMLLFFGRQIGVGIASVASFSHAFTLVWNILRWPVILALMMMALSALYRYAPTIKLSWRETTPGAITATVAWVVVTLAFSYYVNNFRSYDKTYGSIGAIIALLFWMYASAFVILLGGEVNARLRELQHEKAIGTKTQGSIHMRKEFMTPNPSGIVSTDRNWLDLLTLARVQLTSEDPAHPIESALDPTGGVGWRASEPGRQTIRLLFDEPLKISHIHLEFRDIEVARTQEFFLCWSSDEREPCREIVRQQFNFSPPDACLEAENYIVDLVGVKLLELNIVADISRGNVRATLAQLRLA